MRYILLSLATVSGGSTTVGLGNAAIFCNINKLSNNTFSTELSPILSPNVIGTMKIDEFSSLAAKSRASYFPLTSAMIDNFFRSFNATNLTTAVELSGSLATATVNVTDQVGYLQVRTGNTVVEEITAPVSSDPTVIQHGAIMIELTSFGSSWSFAVSDESNTTLIWNDNEHKLSSDWKLHFEFSAQFFSIVSGEDQIMTSTTGHVAFTIADMTIEVIESLIIISWENDSTPLTYWISMIDGTIICFVDNSGPYLVGGQLDLMTRLAAAMIKANTVTSIPDGASVKLLTAFHFDALESGPACKPEFSKYDELMLIELGGNIVPAQKQTQTCVRACRAARGGGYYGGYCGCYAGRSDNTPSSAACSVRESNAFAVTSMYSTLVTRCLTPGTTADNQSDVIDCVISTLPSVGIELLDGVCFECIVDFIDTKINRALSFVRTACTADPFGSECISNVDFADFVTCTNGYDPRYPRIESYCSESKTRLGIETSVYRTITGTCLKDIPNLSNCIATMEADLKGLSPDCFSCWSDLFDAFMDMLICENEQTEPCPTTLSKAITRFQICAGFDPSQIDLVLKTHLQEPSKGSVASLPMLTIVVFTIFSMMFFN